MIPLIDMDVVCYRAGFGANNGDWIMNIEYTDNIIHRILDRFETNEYKGFLTGKNNFRYQVATIAPYKGNRKDAPRPRYYKDLREYLEYEWHAEVTEGIEADDAIGIAHCENTVIASVDKDFRTIPGYFYNIATGVIETIFPEEAINNYLVQLLTGDKIDNIPGLPNPLKSHHKNPPNFTENTAREFLSGRDITYNLSEIQKLYENHYQTDKAFDEIATLLWIQRKDAKTYKECNLLYPTNVLMNNSSA